MNISDITNALHFLHIKDEIYLVPPIRENVPLVKREVFRILGQPRKTIGDALYYGNKCIHVIPAIMCNRPNHRDTRGRDINSMYYVGWRSGREIDILYNANMYVIDKPERSIELWKSLNMSVESMIRALMVDGYNERESVDILSCYGLV